jgi:hypothetical protein
MTDAMTSDNVENAAVILFMKSSRGRCEGRGLLVP